MDLYSRMQNIYAAGKELIYEILVSDRIPIHHISEQTPGSLNTFKPPST